MKRTIWLLGILLIVCQFGWTQTRRREPLGDAARRARAARAGLNLSNVPFYNNDNLPKGGAVSLMGRTNASKGGGSKAAAGGSATGGAEAAGAGGAAAGQSAGDDCDETCWRGKFTAARQAIKGAEKELDILQREEKLARTQYYKDPNQAQREQYSNSTAGGAELRQLKSDIETKRKDVEKLKQDLRTLEGDLRKAGKPAGWGREQPAR